LSGLAPRVAVAVTVCDEANFLGRLRWRARNRKSRSGGHRTAHFRNCRLEVRFHRYDFGEAVKVRADFADL
jgi:hypothetical protein